MPDTAPPVATAPEPPHEHNLNDIETRLEAVEKLVKIFRLERYVYLVISMLSFLLLLVFAVVLALKSSLDGANKLLLLLFAPPAGIMVYVSGAFLRMWSDALAVVSKTKPTDGEQAK